MQHDPYSSEVRDLSVEYASDAPAFHRRRYQAQYYCYLHQLREAKRLVFFQSTVTSPLSIRSTRAVGQLHQQRTIMINPGKRSLQSELVPTSHQTSRPKALQ
jgi:hypothetical protein